MEGPRLVPLRALPCACPCIAWKGSSTPKEIAQCPADRFRHCQENNGGR